MHQYASEEERLRDEELFFALAEDKARRDEEEARERSEEASLAKERNALLNSFPAYFAWMMENQYPALHFAPSWHYDLIAEYLQLFYQREILYLIINVPPRTGKTLQVSQAFPTWTWAKDPLPSFIGASFDMKLAAENNEKRRRIIKSPAYQRLFGHRVQIRFGADREALFENTRGGTMRATSAGANITGRGGDFILMDDVCPYKQAESEAQREAIFEWVDNSLLTRRNNLAASPMALIEQRVGERDATHHLLKSIPEDQLTHLNIPLVAPADEEWVFPISGRVVHRAKGEALLPSRNTAKVIATLQKKPRTYSTQYQGKPIPKAGTIFKREWWQFYGSKAGGYERQRPTRFDEMCISVDATFKAKKDNDQVAILVCGRVKADRYVLDRHTTQMGFTDTCKAIAAMKRKHPEARRIYIEDKANGPAIIDQMKGNLGGIIPVEPIGSKEARAEAASDNVESGNWYLPGEAPWVDDWIENFEAFPNVDHDDDVDAFSQADFKMQKGALSGIGQWLEEQFANKTTDSEQLTVFEKAELAALGEKSW